MNTLAFISRGLLYWDKRRLASNTFKSQRFSKLGEEGEDWRWDLDRDFDFPPGRVKFVR